MAIALGDPVGPAGEGPGTFHEFTAFCRASGWHVALHQSAAACLPIYAAQGYRSICIGEDAIVDLSSFGLQGKGMKEFRNTVTRFDKLGCTVERAEAPLPSALVDELAEVSAEWLRLPGRRERRFTLGRFAPEYVASTPVYVARDADGRALAFLNIPPACPDDAVAIDLMRRREAAPNGVIDYLFTKTFLDLKTRGVTSVNLGMAPLSGLSVRNGAGWEERLVYAVFRRVDCVFSFRGLRSFKAKYATRWEPRYAVYSSPLDLLRLGLALRGVTEIGHA
jgi:phosphatidylglycerol lysyltransferase